MAINIGPRIGIEGESEYRKSLQNVIQQTKTLKSEFDKIASASDKNTNSLKKNAEEHRILAQQIDKQKERVQQLSQMVDKSTEKWGENDTKTLKWKEALNQAEAELSQLETKLRELPSSLEIVGDKMEEVGDKIKGVGQGIKSMGSALTPLSTAATATIGASVKVFSDFESQMSRVKAISGATGDEFLALSDKAREMGSSTKYTATESGQAFEYMAMAGWKTEQMLEGIAPVMNLAAASGEELGTVSDIVTDALTAFGLEAQDAARFTDVLAATATNANTNVGMMGESFKYAAPVAGSLGYSIEDVSLALGLMANNGIKADMAGTALRNMMQRMAKPTKESAAAMDRLGVYLSDDEGKMYSLREILDQLRSSFGQINMPIETFNNVMASLDEQLEDGTITEKQYNNELEELVKQAYGAEASEKARAAAMLAGARAMPALLAIVNTSEKDYRKLASAIDNSAGAAQKMADTMIDNTAGSLTIMKSALEGAGIELGEVFAPYVTKAAEKVQDLAVSFSNMSTSEKEAIAKQIAFVAAAAPTLKVIGGMTEGIGNLVSNGGKFIKFLGELSPAAGPMALAIAGVGAATVGIIALQNAIDEVRTESIHEAMSNALTMNNGVPVEEALNNITDKITELSGSFEMISEKSNELDQAKSNVSNLVFELDKISVSLNAGVMTAEEAAPQLESLLGELADAISTKLGAAADVLLATFSEGGYVDKAFQKTGNSAEELRKQVVQSMDDQQKKVYELQETMNSVEFGSEEWDAAYEELMKLYVGTDELQANVTKFSDYINTNPMDWSKYFNGESFDSAGFQSDLQSTMDKAKEFETNMQTSMEQTYAAVDELNDPELSARVREVLPYAFNSAKGDIATAATESVDAIQNDLIGGIDEVINQAEADWSKMNPLAKLVLWNGDEGGYIKAQVEKYKTDEIDPVAGIIEESMKELGVEGAGWASDASSEIIQGLFDVPSMEEQANGAKTKLKTNWTDIFNTVSEDVKKVAEERAADIISGFDEGINTNAAESEVAAQTWMQKFKDAIHNSVMQFGSPSRTAMEFGKDTVDGFDQGITENQAASDSVVASWMGSIQTAISTKVPDILGEFDTMKSGITSTMDEAYSNIKGAWDKIIQLFNTKLEFPQIKLPHFKISGQFSLNPPKTPSFDVDWYAKAMNNGMRLDGATIFGAAGSTLLGGGEVGPEWIVGERSLMGMVSEAVKTGMGYVGNNISIGDTNIYIDGAGADAEEIANRVDEIITLRLQQAEATWA